MLCLALGLHSKSHSLQGLHPDRSDLWALSTSGLLTPSPHVTCMAHKPSDRDVCVPPFQPVPALETHVLNPTPSLHTTHIMQQHKHTTHTPHHRTTHRQRRHIHTIQYTHMHTHKSRGEPCLFPGKRLSRPMLIN